MTSPRSAFLVQMLDKLGAPLLGAVSLTAAKRADGAAGPKEAEAVAELLGKAVQVGIALGDKMDLRGGEDDAVRLALTGLAASLIAGHYREAGRAPDEAETKRLLAALEAVLAFADNFTPAADNTARLQALSPAVLPADESQAAVQYVNILAPVINEIALFSFGQPEKKLAQDVASRLMTEAASLRGQLLNGSSNLKEDRLAELGLLRALAALYTECHRAEKTRLAASSDEERAAGTQSTDRLWQAFEARLSMMSTLARSALPAGNGVSSSGGNGIAPAAVPAPESRPLIAQPLTPPAAAPPPATPPPAEDSGHNPMAFFKKKGDTAGQS